MAEEQVVKLLEEIRDLQKAHIDNYKDALKNQQQSLEMQRRAVRRQKIALAVGALWLATVLALWVFVSVHK